MRSESTRHADSQLEGYRREVGDSVTGLTSPLENVRSRVVQWCVGSVDGYRESCLRYGSRSCVLSVLGRTTGTLD